VLAGLLLVHAPPPFGIVIAEPGRDLVGSTVPEAALVSALSAVIARPTAIILPIALIRAIIAAGIIVAVEVAR
jgi:hypothetical protein